MTLGEIYTKWKGSEAGLGDVVLASWDRNREVVSQRRLMLKQFDPNMQLSNPMDFTLTGVDGSKLSLASLRGKVIVLDFWATWCAPCRAQHPLYDKVKEKYKGRDDVVFLAIDTDEDRALVPPFVAARKWTYNAYYEDGLAILLKVSSIPSTLIYDGRGELVSRMNGFDPDRFVAMLSDRIDEALKSRGRPARRRRNRGRDGPIFNRVVWIVLDSVGIGEMPDAAAYGDIGSNTLGNIARLRGLRLPNLARLGLGNIRPLSGIELAAEPMASFGRCTLASPGKDTTTGHWEMVGIHLAQPLPLFPRGFPPEIMEEFERRIGRSTLGNCAASGTEIISELGAEHMRTGSPIIYTSADSVFQIAAHEEVIPLWELYKMCETARDILRGPYEVGRVIARPFLGAPGSFARTTNRKDYAVPPPKGMLLDQLENAAVPVYSVGKIFDVFPGTRHRPAHENGEQCRWHGENSGRHG